MPQTHLNQLSVGVEELQFRVATLRDWPQIWPVFRAVIKSGDTYMFDPSIEEAIAKDAWMSIGTIRALTYVAELGNEVIGTAILRPNQPGLGDHIANAAWMVHPDSAGRGVGRRFAEYVINEAIKMGFEAMQFNAVVAGNERAIRLWNSLGFEVVGRVPAAFRTVQHTRNDVLIMYMSLDARH